jgi:NADPH:quinone reductase-like Zn-dependent oxidoreductase
MKAIVQDEYGSPDVLELRDIDKPEIADDEVLLRVHAAGVDRSVWHIMTGQPYLMRIGGYGLRAPKNPVLGTEVAGVVEAVGKNVTRLQPGDEVFGIGKGSYAEYARAPQDKLAPKPANLAFEQAAVVAISDSAALQGLRDHGRVEPGQKALIIGASGGVGTFAVQIAKAFGAHVTGVCSTTKVEMVRSIGADHVIDYTREDFADVEDQRYDLILDIGGNSSLSRLRRALTPKRNPRHRRRRRGRTVARRHRSPAPGDDAVPIRRPEAEDVRLHAEPRGSDRPQGAHRIRQAHTGHRQDVPARRGPRVHPLSGRRTR